MIKLYGSMPWKAASIWWVAVVVVSLMTVTTNRAQGQYLACSNDAQDLIEHCGTTNWCGGGLVVCTDFNLDTTCHWQNSDDLSETGPDPCGDGGFEDDYDPCTHDYCDKSINRCRHEPISGCMEPPTATPTPTVDPDAPTPIMTRPVDCSAISSEDFLIWCCNKTFKSEIVSDPCTEAHPINITTCGLYEKPDCSAATPTATPALCAGDCNGDGRVSINEVVMAVNIALGEEPMAACKSADLNEDGTMSIGELVHLVSMALDGCGS